MKKNTNTTGWELVSVPQKAVDRRFVSEKTGRELCEIILPDDLPARSPEIGGWHFFMPGTCVGEQADAVVCLRFPAAWRSIRFYSPYVRGKRDDVMEYPLADGLTFLRDVFGA